MSNQLTDRLKVSLVYTANFDGLLEIPRIEKPNKIIIPKGMVPFSKRKRITTNDYFICFYEYDNNFDDVIENSNNYLDEFKRFPGIISPDSSICVDDPLITQIDNIFINRAIAYNLQHNGLNVIPNVRWGDHRTYTTDFLPEKVAFLGLPKHSIVSIGSYGCLKNKMKRFHFRQGLLAMLEELEPEIVLVYGAMPKDIFGDLTNKTHFIQYPDWITQVKAGGN